MSMMSRSIIQISRVGLISMLTRSYATRSPFWQFYEWQKMRSQQPLKNEYEEEFLKVFPSGIVYLPKEDGRSEFNEEEKKVLERHFKSYPQRCRGLRRMIVRENLKEENCKEVEPSRVTEAGAVLALEKNN